MEQEAAGRHQFKTLLDLCQTSTPEVLEASLRLADKAKELTANAPEAELEPLFRRSPPADNPFAPGWRHGVNAARTAMATLGINDADPSGATKLFDALKIDVAAGESAADIPLDSSIETSETGFIVGAVERDQSKSRIACCNALGPSVVSLLPG